MTKRYRQVLTIAGSDSGGGAGIQADLKTFSALGCYGMSVVTALTAQNTTEVRSTHEVPASFVGDQIDAVCSDIGVDAVKIGMLHRPAIIEVVAERLKYYEIGSIVLDPVMVAKSGDFLLEKAAVQTLKESLIPLAKVLTPNLPEATALLGRETESPEEMERAASELLELGPEIVVLKGGHSKSHESDDYVCFRNPQGSLQGEWLHSQRILTQNTHGTGCTFSSAIAAFLSQGLSPLEAIREAKRYLSSALEAGSAYRLGSGHGPVHHFFQFWNHKEKQHEIQ